MFRSILFVALFAFYTNADSQTITNYTTDDGLPDNDVTCLVHDGDGNMWFGTQNGVAKFDGLTWEIHNTSTDAEIPQDAITAIAIAKNGDVWIGTDAGVALYNGTEWKAYTKSDGLGSDRINYISCMENGDIWFAEFNGATKYDGTSFVSFGNSDGLPFGGIVYVKEDINRDVLLCAGLGGLIIYDGANFTTYSTDEGLVSKNTTAVALDGNGAKWIGTANGVSVLNASNMWVENHTQMLTIPAPDTLNPVEDVAIDKFGNVWVGIYVDYLVTVGGVAMYDGTTWTTFDESDGLIGPTVRKITLDGVGNLWVGTSSGVSKISSPTASIKGVQSQTKNFLVFPNPASDVITIKRNNSTVTSCQIDLYNAQGQIVVHEIVTAGNSVELSIAQLNPGIYYIKCEGQVQKLVIE